MRFAIAYSIKDKAGINIVNQLKKANYLPHVPIIELKKETVYSEDISAKKYPELRNVDFLIFASKHQSKEKTPSLSLHAPGNFRNADFGGKPGKVCNTSAFVLKYLFKELNKNANESEELKDKYKITLECTHHGPLIDIPCCFIELGSSEAQWGDEIAASVIAKTIASLQNYKKGNWIPCLVVGGGHYNHAGNKIMLRTNYAIGHIIPKYLLPITTPIINEAVLKTQENFDTVLLDWKGLGGYKQETVSLIKKAGLNYKKVQRILKEE